MEQSEHFSYRAYAHRKFLAAIASLAIAIIVLLSDLYLTTSPYMTFDTFIHSLFMPDDVDKIDRIIVRNVQLPIALMGIFAGAAFGFAGAVMQTMLNNPLASPYTLGISAGAGLGASIAIAAGVSGISVLGTYLIPGCAFIFALLACGGIFIIAEVRKFSASALVLAGIGLVFFFQALQSLLQYFMDSDSLRSITFWLMGSLERANWTNLSIVIVLFVIVFLLLYRRSWQMTAIRLGDNKARSLGVDVKRLREVMFVLISLMIAGCVSFVGCIGFIGIVGPHIARMLVGEDQRYLLIMSALIGAIVLEIADILSKLIIVGVVFPIGIITSIIGVPFFFALIMRRRTVVID